MVVRPIGWRTLEGGFPLFGLWSLFIQRNKWSANTLETHHSSLKRHNTEFWNYSLQSSTFRYLAISHLRLEGKYQRHRGLGSNLFECEKPSLIKEIRNQVTDGITRISLTWVWKCQVCWAPTVCRVPVGFFTYCILRSRFLGRTT